MAKRRKASKGGGCLVTALALLVLLGIASILRHPANLPPASAPRDVPTTAMTRPTRTPEASRALTDTPAPFVPQDAARATAEASLDWALSRVTWVEAVRMVSVIAPETGALLVYAEADVRAGGNTGATAETMHMLARSALQAPVGEFAVILDDGAQAVSYLWTARNEAWQVTPLTLTGMPPTPIPTDVPDQPSTRAPTQAPPPPTQGQRWQCGGDIYNCGSFGSRADMNSYWASCPGDPSNLDGDGDGDYCE